MSCSRSNPDAQLGQISCSTAQPCLRTCAQNSRDQCSCNYTYIHKTVAAHIAGVYVKQSHLGQQVLVHASRTVRHALPLADELAHVAHLRINQSRLYCSKVSKRSRLI